MLAQLDFTITLGNLLTIIVTILTAIIAVWKVSLVLAELKWQVDLMWKDYKKDHGINGNNHHEE